LNAPVMTTFRRVDVADGSSLMNRHHDGLVPAGWVRRLLSRFSTGGVVRWFRVLRLRDAMDQRKQGDSVFVDNRRQRVLLVGRNCGHCAYRAPHLRALAWCASVGRGRCDGRPGLDEGIEHRQDRLCEPLQFGAVVWLLAYQVVLRLRIGSRSMVVARVRSVREPARQDHPLGYVTTRKVSTRRCKSGLSEWA
jgi:hypothetical protein